MRDGAIISVPYAGASWQTNLGPTIDGFEVYQFSGNNVILTVSYPLKEISGTLYHVTLNNKDIGLCWQANVDTSGQVIETGLNAEMFPELVIAASDYCQDQGYQYEMNPKDEEKQCGICTFSDASTCNAWAFYQGFCQPGDHPAEK
jgi:putative hemolysin